MQSKKNQKKVKRVNREVNILNSLAPSGPRVSVRMRYAF